MGFIVAPLGKLDNKIDFVSAQTGVYPDIAEWKLDEENRVTLQEIKMNRSS